MKSIQINHFLTALIAGIFLFAFSAYADSKQPNIVFIMADDLGPGWVDYDGTNPEINTPNLQHLAKSGMVFTRAYAAASVCSPTRAACITGMSPAQIGMTTHISGRAGRVRPGPKGGLRDAETLKHLPLELPSYARELKKLGYATGFLDSKRGHPQENRPARSRDSWNAIIEKGIARRTAV